MFRQIGLAAGYSQILLLPALLVVGLWAGHPLLAFVVTMLLLPLGRLLFGSIGRRPVWNEAISTYLHRLPLAYALVLAAALAATVVLLGAGYVASAGDAVATGMSLWVTLLLGTCVAHELVHRRSPRHALVGAIVCGLTGYPLLAEEHLLHHARNGDTASAEWPRRDESSWRFAWRRLRSVARLGVDAASNAMRGIGGKTALRLGVALATSTAVMMGFVWAGGWLGLLVYLGTSAAVALGVQLMTYLQHWGLGDDSIDRATERPLAWEDDCRLQAFMTLHISLHQAHHETSRLPYYRVQLSPQSPRLPAGYVVLLFLSVVPPLWIRTMTPVLDRWTQSPSSSVSTGRRLTCFASYDAYQLPNRSTKLRTEAANDEASSDSRSTRASSKRAP
jgi:fatty acid desaturase